MFAPTCDTIRGTGDGTLEKRGVKDGDGDGKEAKRERALSSVWEGEDTSFDAMVLSKEESSKEDVTEGGAADVLK